jgi:hypothetical protein
VVEHISSLCTFMEDCLKEWMHHIGVQRTEAYYLNHFTTKQLVILQNELAKVNSAEKKDLSKNIYPLLSQVKKNCNYKDLRKAMYEAFDDLAEKEIKPSASEKMACTDDVEDDDGAAVEQETITFLESMSDSGFPADLAKLAMKEVGAANVEEGKSLFVWSL